MQKTFSIWSVLWLVLAGLVLYLPGLGGGTRVLTRHEVLAAQPAREMLHAGRVEAWVVPQFAGEGRLVKPPTTGWVLASAMWITGSEAEWVVRIPGVLACIGAAIGLAWLVSRQWGENLGGEMGLISGMTLLTAYGFQMQGRLAEADIFQAAAVTGAFVCFGSGVLKSEVWSGRKLKGEKTGDGGPSGWGEQNWLSVLFFLFAGLAFLFKAVGLIFIVAGVVAYVIWHYVLFRNWKPVWFLFSPIGSWGGWVVLAVFLGGWPVAAMWYSPGIEQVWYRELVGRSTGQWAEPDAWHVYFWSVPMLLLPWVFAGGVVAVPLIGNWGKLRVAMNSTFVRLMICWCGAGLLILQLSTWKHKHYVLPMLPPLVVMCAVGLRAWAVWGQGQPVGKRVVAVLLWGAANIAGALWMMFQADETVRTAAILPLLLGAGGVCVLMAESYKSVRWQLTGVFVTAIAVSAAAQVVLQPRFDGYRVSAEFGRRVGEVVPGEEKITLVGMGENHVAYYLPLPLGRVDKVQDVSEKKEAVSGWVIAPKKVAMEMFAEREIVLEGPLTRREGDKARAVLIRPVE